MNSEYLTAQEAARLIGITYRAARDACSHGTLASVKFCHQYAIRIEDAVEYKRNRAPYTIKRQELLKQIAAKKREQK